MHTLPRQGTLCEMDNKLTITRFKRVTAKATNSNSEKLNYNDDDDDDQLRLGICSLHASPQIN